MSSGEKAKPPATYEERNPFDISRRSEKDIAAEIAQRMAAWKQARGRSYATPSTVPSGEAKLPPVSAPVQPARLPKSGGPAAPAPQAAPTAAKAAQPGARVPLFATVSAMRRAMPPAPSLKRPLAPPEAPIATPTNEAPEIEAPKTATVETAATQSAVPAHVESVAERAVIDKVDAAVEAPATSSPRLSDNVVETLHGEAPLEAAMSDGDAHADEQREVDRSSGDAPETLAIEVRDLSSTAMPEIEPAAPETEARDSEVERPSVDMPTMEAREPDSALEIEAPVAESKRIELTAPAIPSIEALEAVTRRIEGRERREPIFAAPAAPSMEALEAHDVEAEPVHEHDVDTPVAESGRIELTAPAIPSIQGLEAVTRRIEGRERREPTFDEPAAEPPAVEDAAPAPLAVEQQDQAAPTGTRAIALPSIETRIETRRIDSLRADPRMAGRRPIFPHIDPEEWPAERDIPPVVAARAQHQPRGGTGWAIGLGAMLLIAGITAPAAIWQGRQQAPADQDQLVMLPAPTSLSQPETTPATQATLPAPPQPEMSAPEIPQPETAQPPVTAAEAQSAPPAPDVAQPAPEDQTTLSAVQSDGELNEAPISTPPAPVLDLASKPKVQFPQAQPDVAAGEVPFPPAARPFVPEPGMLQGAKPFLPAPADASVPVNSTAMPAGTQAGAQTASIALKPNLMGQLKPKAPAAAKAASNAPQKVVRKPKPFFRQSPDQMFQTLIDTLSEGQPVNPATKPVPPSTRK